MSGAIIAQLIIQLGPMALELIPKLVQIWTTNLTQEEVNTFCNLAKKSYDDYMNEGKAKPTV